MLHQWIKTMVYMTLTYHCQLQHTPDDIYNSSCLVHKQGFNAIPGNTRTIAGKYVTSVRHGDGHRLISFCSANDIFIRNINLEKDYITAFMEGVPRMICD